MEKTALLPQQIDSECPQKSDQRLTITQRALLLFVVLTNVYGLYLTFAPWPAPQLDAPSITNNTDFDWFRQPSRRELQYQPCYSNAEANFECARLSVPLDHFNDTTSAEISLAVIRLPAAVPPTHPQYGGAILFNPGGPGGRGVNFLLRGWKPAAAAIHYGQDANDTKYYDFISFDPRGVGASAPMISCFSNTLSRWTWALRIWEEGILGSSDAAFGRLWSMSRAQGGSCSLSAIRDPDDIKKFVSTASAATDMLHIVERHGEWREAEAARLLSGSKAAIPQHLLYSPGKEKISYWGYSYGTYLGMTFASMYPDRISRLILDGVVDAEDYVKSLWFDNLIDTEKEMKSFYSYCASAGYPACALAKKGSTSADVEARVSDILDSLLHNPLPIIGTSPEVITYSDVKHLIFVSLYSPMAMFPVAANILADIEQGNGTSMAYRIREIHEPYCPSQDAISIQSNQTKPQERKLEALSQDASTGIACTDGDSQQGLSRDDAREHWRELEKMSPTIGPMWAMFRMRCAHYTVRPLYRYAGPWTGNTSFPILFIGNSADPVTPVRNARKMARGYRSAGVLEQESSGHCSTSAPSRCTREVIYRYFQLGELPEPGKHCSADQYPFETVNGSTISIAEVSDSFLTNGLAGAFMPVV
ncbi:hypothetical protein AMS68_000994 [Peltaster fructicola]|uniref:Uncharacterized protein n=1 Tax=Peltaster fructicola TaxID=286661 RepID=A0A6H0XL55_9PEZI|nr:hypothetical protein AMS68_000994 [Peltaster fructicola]